MPLCSAAQGASPYHALIIMQFFTTGLEHGGSPLNVLITTPHFYLTFNYSSTVHSGSPHCCTVFHYRTADHRASNTV